jgi:beta-phosphoglucomutase-like phosphatase (HAD superfamily)
MYDHFDALIFDMDGTLVDSGQLHEVAWTETLNRFASPSTAPTCAHSPAFPPKARWNC